MIDHDAELNARMAELISRHAECGRLEKEREAEKIAAQPKLSHRETKKVLDRVAAWFGKQFEEARKASDEIKARRSEALHKLSATRVIRVPLPSEDVTLKELIESDSLVVNIREMVRAAAFASDRRLIDDILMKFLDEPHPTSENEPVTQIWDEHGRMEVECVSKTGLEIDQYLYCTAYGVISVDIR